MPASPILWHQLPSELPPVFKPVQVKILGRDDPLTATLIGNKPGEPIGWDIPEIQGDDWLMEDLNDPRILAWAELPVYEPEKPATELDRRADAIVNILRQNQGQHGVVQSPDGPSIRRDE